ncbi:IS6 family transposase [Legionella fallonii]|uniref:IS6 family transposase n=1 Tax=Legionella fallonii TaxID=96230 RepID=UPI001E39166F|nr:IS6 family transposase [Legionella fallonii]
MTPLIKLYTWPSAIMFKLCFPVFFVRNHTYIRTVLVPLIRWHNTYPLTVNNLEELAAERRVYITFSNVLINYLNQWHTPFLVRNYNKWLAPPTSGNWVVKQYPVKSCGQRVYLYTLVDRDNKIIDFIALDSNDESIARSFFNKSVNSEGVPVQIEAYLSTLRSNPRKQWAAVLSDE